MSGAPHILKVGAKLIRPISMTYHALNISYTLFPQLLQYIVTIYHRFTWWENTCFCNKSMGSKSETMLILPILKYFKQNFHCQKFIHWIFYKAIYFWLFIYADVGCIRKSETRWYDKPIGYFIVLYFSICFFFLSYCTLRFNGMRHFYGFRLKALCTKQYSEGTLSK